MLMRKRGTGRQWPLISPSNISPHLNLTSSRIIFVHLSPHHPPRSNTCSHMTRSGWLTSGWDVRKLEARWTWLCNAGKLHSFSPKHLLHFYVGGKKTKPNKLWEKAVVAITRFCGQHHPGCPFQARLGFSSQTGGQKSSLTLHLKSGFVLLENAGSDTLECRNLIFVGYEAHLGPQVFG